MVDGGSPATPILDWFNVFTASIFVFFTAWISHSIGLRLGFPLIISSIRCVLQLTLMGFVLDDVLHVNNIKPVMLITVTLVLLGSYETVYHRTRRTLKGLFPIIFLVLLISNGVVCYLGVTLALNESPFWRPVTFIPVMGMLLGNSMGSIAMATGVCVDSITIHAPVIETRLSYGASRYEAVKTLAVQAIRVSMLPALTQLSVMGMINIPGMMTGQILAGMRVQEAVIYQEVIMFMVSASCGFGVLLTVCACMVLLVDSHHAIRKDRIIEAHPEFIRIICRQIYFGIQWLIRSCSQTTRRHHE
ncbi:hypothetical protein INT45_002593 [Circinella minor]|uniref:Uncharacterized protein n=1 Tax=Circinella minor TaxID=1195481 RepID=A0A8H7S122_9FUNG|nr:hypothetical protein INT45_002593 [Circinella minor]